MQHIFLTVAAYLGFNIAIWLSIGQGGMIALAGANILGGLITALIYRREIREQGIKPHWQISLLGSIGILLIVLGLRASHTHLPVSLSMEAVYNGFAISTWPMFLVLSWIWSTHFKEKPNWFDLLCHLAMAILVICRFVTYGQYNLTIGTIGFIGVAISGYALFNISIKLSQGHRATNVLMNLGGGVFVLIGAVVSQDIGQWQWSPQYLSGLFLGGVMIYALVRELGNAYNFFGQKQQASLIAPLVYDGILVASPLVMLVTGEFTSAWTFVIAIGMLVVTWLRYHYHTRKQ